jgi:hypothetical protein
VPLAGVKSGISQQHFYGVGGGWVMLENSFDILFNAGNK